MTTKLFAFAIIIAFALPAFAQETRYYGVDNHASVASACAATLHSASTLKLYTISGDKCSYFTTLFLTSKFAQNSGVNAQTQEDDLLAKTALVLEQGLVVVSTKGPKDRTVNNVVGREELVQFKKDISQGYIWEFTDNSVAGTIYVTAVCVTLDPFADAQDSSGATAAVAHFLKSIQIAAGVQ